MMVMTKKLQIVITIRIVITMIIMLTVTRMMIVMSMMMMMMMMVLVVVMMMVIKMNHNGNSMGDTCKNNDDTLNKTQKQYVFFAYLQ